MENVKALPDFLVRILSGIIANPNPPKIKENELSIRHANSQTSLRVGTDDRLYQQVMIEHRDGRAKGEGPGVQHGIKVYYKSVDKRPENTTNFNVIEREAFYRAGPSLGLAQAIGDRRTRYEIEDLVGDICAFLAESRDPWIVAPRVKLEREDRIYLASRYYGLYMAGMAVSEGEKIDEDCAMDNTGIPRYVNDMPRKLRLVLKERPGTSLIYQLRD